MTALHRKVLFKSQIRVEGFASCWKWGSVFCSVCLSMWTCWWANVNLQLPSPWKPLSVASCLQKNNSLTNYPLIPSKSWSFFLLLVASWYTLPLPESFFIMSVACFLFFLSRSSSSLPAFHLVVSVSPICFFLSVSYCLFLSTFTVATQIQHSHHRCHMKTLNLLNVKCLSRNLKKQLYF